ncbi:MAG: hypothetical protein RR140_00580 [Clostridia bacterium]
MIEKNEKYCQKNNVIESIALEETGLAHILNAEGEKLQKALELATCVDDLLKINCSVQSTIMDVTSLEIMLYNKLKTACCCDCCPCPPCPPIPPCPPTPPCPPPPCIPHLVSVEGIVYNQCGKRLINAEVFACGKNITTTHTNNCGYFCIPCFEVCDKLSIYAECNGQRSVVITINKALLSHYCFELKIFNIC